EVVLEMDLAPQVKRVATRYAEVRVFTERPIGEAVRVPATEGELGRGQVAEVTWNGLKAWPAGSGSYGWYVKAADSYGGVALSELQGLAVE
ncbi:MAG: metallophosphoesterase, partial [Paenibacillaceae bacterium]|nr:metallophosphoesterase [Paenibacillaceae bacterium]